MSTFPSPISAPHLATIRASHYWSRPLVGLCPSDVVFKARAAESITDDPFITFEYDTVTVGSEADAWEGFIVYLSHTDSIREAYYRGRVRVQPSGGDFYIDLNSSELDDNDYVIVVRDTDLFSCVRNDTLIDSAIPYHDLPPTTIGLPFVVVLYDAEDASTVTWSPVQTGLPVDAAATSVDTWLWDVSGDGTSSMDDDTAQHPEFTFEAGHHYIVRVRYEDDNGTSNYQMLHVYAITRTFDAPVVTPLVAGSISLDMENAGSTTVTAYGDVSTLPDRTHAVIFHVQHFGDNSSTPIITNVLMNGRIRSESIETSGSVEAGALRQTTFTIEGLSAYLQQMRFPNDIVRATDTPNEWGEGEDWNPFRMSVYVAYVYSTLLHLGSFGVEDGSFAAYDIGGKPRGIEGGYAMDVLSSILDPIKAAVNMSPDGELFLARTASYREAREDIPFIAAFTLDDIPEYTVNRDSSRNTAQVIAFGGVYDSAIDDIVLYTASAPSIVYGDGETRELTRELLTADATATEAAEELGLRASNDYAYHNPKDLLTLTLIDSWTGVVRPTNYQRWAAVLPASSNVRGLAYSATGYFQLQSVTLTLGTDGTIGTQVELARETSLDDAQVIAIPLPDNASDMNPVLPVLPNEPAFPTDPLELYPTDLPALEDLQAIDPYSAAASYTPLTPDQAAAMARNQGTANSKTLRVLFSQSTNTVSPWLTVTSAPYLISFSGATQISGPETCGDFTQDPDGWNAPTFLNWVPDEGFMRDDFRGRPDRLLIGKFIAGTTTTFTLTTNENIPEWVDIRNLSGLTVYERQYGPASSFTFNGTFVDGVSFDIGTSGVLPAPNPDLPSTLRVISVCYEQDTGDFVTKGDAFYIWDEAPDGTRSNVRLYDADEGLFIDNVKFAAIPPYSTSGSYPNIPFTGTGNQLNARMQFNDYSLVNRQYLYADLKRVVS